MIFTLFGATLVAYDAREGAFTRKHLRSGFVYFITVLVFGYAGLLLLMATFFISNETQNQSTQSDAFISAANVESVLFNGIGYAKF
jgi:hypothetical protein